MRQKPVLKNAKGKQKGKQEVKTRKDELVREQKKLVEITTEVEAEKTESKIRSVLQKYQNDKNVLWKIKKSINTCEKEKLYLVKDQEGNRIYEPDGAKEVIAQFYERLSIPRKIDESIAEWQTIIDKQMEFYESVKEYDNLHLNRKITMEEIKDGLKSVQRSKANGPDEVANEFLVEGGKTIQKMLLTVFNNIYREEKIAEEWKEAELVSLYKGKGDPENVGHYRGTL